MKCPKCGGEKIEVKRTEPYDTLIIRRRKCLTCEYEFPTYEEIDSGPDSRQALRQEK